MHIIRHDTQPAQQATITYRLQEQGPTDPPTTLDTVTGRDNALAAFDAHLAEHPVRYRPWTNFRLVLVEGGDR